MRNKASLPLKCLACYLTLGLGLMAVFCLGARAAEKSIKLPDDSPTGQLKPGPNVDVVRNRCVICHSTDYIVRQPASDKGKWEAEVQKMIKVYGAPISEADARAIVEYLATVYGEIGDKDQKGERVKRKR